MHFVSALVVLLCSPSLRADPLEIERARAHFNAGKSYYEAARYEDALREFNEAYRLSQRPPLLFNLSLCHERLGDLDRAISTLEQYLVDDPTTQDRNVIEERIKNLRAIQSRGGAPAPVAAPAPVTVPSSAQPAPPRRLLTVVFGGAGLALLGGALIANLVAGARLSDLNTHCNADGSCDAASFPAAQSDISDGRAAALASYVLAGLGVAALAAAVALFFIEGRKLDRPAARAPSRGASWAMGAF
jgi:tetratricopeptide (TPR) repeat protein